MEQKFTLFQIIQRSQTYTIPADIRIIQTYHTLEEAKTAQALLEFKTIILPSY